MKKFVWKKEFFGFLAFAFGLGFLLLAKFSVVFIFISLLFFLGGAVFNLIPSIKHFNAEKKQTKIIVFQRQKEQIEKVESGENISEEDVLELKNFKRSAKRYVFNQSLNMLMYLAIIILSTSFFIRSLIYLI